MTARLVMVILLMVVATYWWGCAIAMAHRKEIALTLTMWASALIALGGAFLIVYSS